MKCRFSASWFRNGYLLAGGLVCVCLGLSPAAARGEDTKPAKGLADEDIQFYEQTVKPLLEARCYQCHGPEVQEANLRLDTYDGLAMGGASGELYSLERPEDSLLLVAVSYVNEDLQMPPDAKLSQEEIDSLRKWVERGLPHPDRPAKPVAPKSRQPEWEAAARELWSFQPVKRPAVPAVERREWARTAIDHFVLAELTEQGLAPGGVANKRALIRRVTLDLLGVPPAPGDVDEFLADDSPHAYERLVDRLLASPRYGERWGRHWLDVARYADSNGSDENVAHGNAWRYRDYVIAAWNSDKPFDEFTRQQIAGDLFPSEDASEHKERLTATAFLSLGAKVLAEVDERKMEMDIVDEQIDTLGRTFLGLTLGCARCHDHKFDPISMEDYYGLAGIFRSTKTMETFTKVARWYEHSAPTPQELEAQAAHRRTVEDKKAEIQNLVAAATGDLQESLGKGATLPKNPESMFPAETRDKLKLLRDAVAQLEKKPPAVSSIMGVSDGSVSDTAICIRGSHLTLGATVPRSVPAALIRQHEAFPPGESGRRQLAEWLVRPEHPLTSRVMVNRIWRWHFGRGLVESTDNFGALGDKPSHPELLDWLASQLVEQGWSLKWLQRQIVTSSVYRQASGPANDGAKIGAGELARFRKGQAADPDNRLLWHFPVQRLQAETLRDAMLAVSGKLDLTMGGSLLHVANRDYFFNHTSKDETKYDAPRRTVYLPVVRNNLYDLLQLFDATDATVPSGDRSSSTVATQALFLLNSPLVMNCADALAAETQSENEAEQVSALYARCFGRPAAPAEIQQAREFLSDFARTPGQGEATGQAGWSALCQALLTSNEFLYVR